MLNKYVKVLALVALVVVSTGAFATDPVINDVGNANGYVLAAITALGALAGTVFGGFFSFWLLKKAMTWAGRIG